MFKQKKFAVHFELFPVAFVDCSSNLVFCRHFISLMSLFQRHVARRNLPYQGLRNVEMKMINGERGTGNL